MVGHDTHKKDNSLPFFLIVVFMVTTMVTALIIYIFLDQIFYVALKKERKKNLLDHQENTKML